MFLYCCLTVLSVRNVRPWNMLVAIVFWQGVSQILKYFEHHTFRRAAFSVQSATERLRRTERSGGPRCSTPTRASRSATPRWTGPRRRSRRSRRPSSPSSRPTASSRSDAPSRKSTLLASSFSYIFSQRLKRQAFLTSPFRRRIHARTALIPRGFGVFSEGRGWAGVF